MDPVGEYPLQRGPAPPVEPRRNRGALIAAAVGLLAVAGAVAFYLWSRGPRQPVPDTAQAESPAPARDPLGPAVESGPLPPLDLTDPLVRELLGGLSSHPQVAVWLATDGLVRNFVVSLDNVASGATPARHVQVLAPAAPFEVEGRDEITISARSFERYHALADAVASFDPAALAALYSRLKPRLQDAYVELGHPAGDVDLAVERAIVRLLETPVPDGRVRVRHGIASFRFEEEQFEALSPAQKQLVRMGPRNVRMIQSQLWALARELGIPSERLPPRGSE